MTGDADDSKSTSGAIFFLGEGTVTWSTQKQRVMTLSSCEAEYITGTGATCQAVWLHQLLKEMVGVKVSPPRIKMDNMSAIALSKNLILHDRSKHIKILYHFIRECVERGDVVLEFVDTQDQLADMFTKALGRVHFQELREKIEVVKIMPRCTRSHGAHVGSGQLWRPVLQHREQRACRVARHDVVRESAGSRA
jgi:hypothetical protein